MYIGSDYVDTGDFSTYQFVWYYEGPYGTPLLGASFWLEETFTSVKCGRYFAIAKDQETTYDDNALEVTEIEVMSVIE